MCQQIRNTAKVAISNRKDKLKLKKKRKSWKIKQDKK